MYKHGVWLCAFMLKTHSLSCFYFFMKIIDQEINPYVDQWEAEGKFPAHKIFKILGTAGFLGVNKPVGKMFEMMFEIKLASKMEKQVRRVSNMWPFLAHLRSHWSVLGPPN